MVGGRAFSSGAQNCVSIGIAWEGCSNPDLGALPTVSDSVGLRGAWEAAFVAISHVMVMQRVPSEPQAQWLEWELCIQHWGLGLPETNQGT